MSAIPAGYKQTEVGVVPEDWEVATLQQVCAKPITYGIVQCGPHVANGVPYIRVSDMDGPCLDVNGMLRTSQAIASQFSRSQVEKGDVVYALRGKIGEVRTVDQNVAGANLTQGTARLSPSGRVDSTYLLYSLRSQRSLLQADLAAKGSTFREITLEALRQIELPIAPLSEQRAIAAALSDVDALLAKLDQFIAKKRDLKQAAMQQLLTGQTRLPGFRGQWQIASLDMLASRATGVWGKNEPDERNSRLVEIIRAGDIAQDGKLTATALRFVALEEYEKAKCTLDDLVITTSGNGLGKVWWCDGRGNIAASNFVRVLHPKAEKVVGRFLYYALKTEEGLRQLQEHTATSAYPNLRQTYFSTVWIPLPLPPEQTAIATVLSDMDAELAALEARRDKTRTLKQGMMQELLTGRIRLV